MDQPQENTPASQQVRKKTLRDVYANAASGLLLMINDSVVDEMADFEHENTISKKRLHHVPPITSNK
jgi:hypothetical protein